MTTPQKNVCKFGNANCRSNIILTSYPEQYQECDCLGSETFIPHEKPQKKPMENTPHENDCLSLQEFWILLESRATSTWEDAEEFAAEVRRRDGDKVRELEDALAQERELVAHQKYQRMELEKIVVRMGKENADSKAEVERLRNCLKESQSDGEAKLQEKVRELEAALKQLNSNWDEREKEFKDEVERLNSELEKHKDGSQEYYRVVAEMRDTERELKAKVEHQAAEITRLLHAKQGLTGEVERWKRELDGNRKACYALSIPATMIQAGTIDGITIMTFEVTKEDLMRFKPTMFRPVGLFAIDLAALDAENKEGGAK